MALPAFALAARKFSPLMVPGLESWWDAADAASVTLSSGRISQWSDKSGNNRHATNSTAGTTQPSYALGVRNGLNVVRFAAASVQRLQVPSSTATYNFMHNGTPHWWIAVSVFGTSANPNAVLCLFANQPGNASPGVTYAFEDRSSIPRNNGVNAGAGTGIPGTFAFRSPTPAYDNIITPQTTVIQDALVDAGNATAASRWSLRINGGSAIAASTDTATPTTANADSNFTLGAFSSFGGPLEGDICEILIYSQQPTAAARDMIRNYLARKWGVTLA
jgi:hypothetical protein